METFVIPTGRAGIASPARLISPDSAGKVTPDRKGVIKELAARWVGLLVVIIFGVAVWYLFHLASLLFTKFNGSTNNDFSGFVKDALIPFLNQCATTLGAIFGSTLGFVFGYYFKATSDAAAKDSNG